MTQTVHESPAELQMENAVQLPLDCIEPSQYQARRDFPAAEMADLKASISEHGILAPILVRPIEGKRHAGVRYQLVAGERRWRAAKDLSLQLIPAIVQPMSGLQAAQRGYIENAQRENPDDWGLALALRRMMQEHEEENGEPLSEIRLAKSIGKSTGYVRNYLGLFKLKPDVQEMVQRNPSTRSSAFEVNKVTDDGKRREIIEAVDHGASFAAVKGEVQHWQEKREWQRDSQTPPDAMTRGAIRAQEQKQAEARREIEKQLRAAESALLNTVAWLQQMEAKDYREVVAPRLTRLSGLLAQMEPGPSS